MPLPLERGSFSREPFFMLKKISLAVLIVVLTIAGLVGGILYQLQSFSFERVDFFSLKESTSLAYNSSGFLSNIDERANSQYFSFSNETKLVDKFQIIIPRFSVVNKKIKSIAGFLHEQSKTLIPLSLDKIISFSHLQTIERDYSFKNSLNIFKDGGDSEIEWAKRLSILLENNLVTLLQNNFASLWTILQFRILFFENYDHYKYQLLQIGSKKFLFFTTGKQKQYMFFPLNSDSISFYKLIGEQQQVKLLMLDYFSSVQWLDQKYNIPFPLNTDDFTVFTVLDYFTFKELLPEHRSMIEDFSLLYYKKLLTKYDEKNSFLRQEILKSLKELYILSSLKDTSGQTFYRDSFEKKLLELIKLTTKKEIDE